MPTQPTVTIAQAIASSATGLLVMDSAANIVAALPNAALTARISSFTVSAPASLTAAQMSLLFPITAKLHASAGSLQLAGANTVGVAQITSFEALPGFAVASGGSITLADTATQIVGVLLNHLAWLIQVTNVSVQLDGSSMGAYPATLLENMIQHGKAIAFVPTAGHTTLNIVAAAHDLATNAVSLNALGAQQAVTIAANNDGAVVSATDAANLVTLHGFDPSAHNFTISDIGANISPHISAVLGHGFSLVTVTSGTLSGTAAQLLDPSIRYAAGAHAQLAANATINAATANRLAALPGFSAAGHALTVTDTVAGLLSLTPATLTQVTITTLAADSTVSAQQAIALAAEPGFSAGGHQFTVADTATNLLALPHALQVASTLLALSADQTVSAATLTQLAALGIKFGQAGHSITCQDSAASLASLSQAAVALAGSEVIGTSASVSASTAASLAALPHLSLGAGITLSVQDSVANLIALGQNAPSAVSAETLLPGSSVTITAAQAIALASLPHFSPAGANITIADSVANLTAAGTTIVTSIGTAVSVSDSAVNLAASAATSLLQNAASVTLSGNAQVTAGAAALIASIPHFGAGIYQITVSDTAANIALHSTAVTQVASSAIVTDSGPIGTAAADQLALVSAAGILSFQGGNQLIVQDSFAALTSGSNSAGIALAARIGVLDSAANLVTASAHNWGALNPSYALSQGGTISAAQASGLAGLGSHFSANGFSLTVADGAAATVAAGPALGTLHITASVTDTAANLGAQSSALLSLGNALSSVHVSDVTPVSAAVGASLSGLAGLLTGPVLHVSDTAAHVDASLAGLAALTTHIAVVAIDSAANVGAYVADLATLGNHLSVVLTDTVPITASVAAALAPVAANLTSGTQIGVTDTGANVVANTAALSTLSSALGTVTLSDGTTLSAAQAAALSVLDSHLAAGVTLTATGSAASVAANSAGLTELNTDGRLAAVVVSAASVADVTSHATVLNTLPVQIAVQDSSTNVDAGLAGLAQITGLQSITLTDGGTPALSMSLATLSADATTIAKINSPFTVTLSDTAAHLAADMALGNSSVIAAHLLQIGLIVANDSQPVVLGQAQILAAGIDDGAGSALAKFSGSVDVTGVDIAHLNQVATLGHAPSAISVVDSSATIAADIALGNASVLISTATQLTSITVSDHQPVTLTAAEALAAGVDDSPGSLAGLLMGAGIVVTAASVSDLASLSNLTVAPTSISVADTAGNISADLASGQSALVANQATIHTISVVDGQTVVLTEQQVLAAHVDDGAGSVLAETTGGNLAVTGVAASDIAEMLGLGVAPVSLSISDTAAHIVSNLSTVLANIGDIASISVNGASLTLTAAEALSAHVDDGSGSLIDLVTSHAFTVTGASVAQLAALQALPHTPTSIAVTDSSSNIVNDLTSNSPVLPSAIGSLDTITVTHGTLILTDAQAAAILASPSLDSVFGHLAASTIVSVTGVPIADLAGIAASGWPHVTEAVVDTATNILTDLASGNSALQANVATVGSVALDADAAVNAASLDALAALPQFSTGGFALSLQDNIAAIQSLAPTPLALAHDVTVIDTAANLSTALGSLQEEFAGQLHITLTDPVPTLSISSAVYSADQPTIDAVTNSGVFTVTGSAADLASLAVTLGADDAVSSVSVTDLAANVIGAFDSLQGAGPKLSVSLTDSHITANLVPLLLTIPQLTSSSIPVVDTGSQIAALVESGDAASIAYLNVNGASLADSSPVTAADAVALESLTMFVKAGNNLVVWDTAQHLTAPGYATALNNGLIDSVHLKTISGTVTVTATTAATLFGISGFTTDNPSGTSNTLTVSDTTAHIEANLMTLTTNLAHIGNIVVSGSSVVSDQVLSDLQGLGATQAAGTSLTVQDTGAVIAAHAVAQSAGHTITPVAWTLSGNATISEADAVTLGGLSNFSAGPYTITLNLVADTAISVADANKLGNIAGVLNLGSHHIIVGGSVQQLNALSTAALSLVTPALADSLTNVAVLAPTSPLLSGTVEITGSDALTAAAVSALLGLVHTGSGAGIAANSLSFDSAHAVDDTVSNLRSLTTSAAWTSNAALHSALHLIAQDSVATLINPVNTSFLSGLYGTTLQNDVTITAGSAASLAALSGAIHFNRASSHITVQDSASNLVSSANSAGVGLADTVLLAGPDHLDAADTETLLGIAHLSITGALTIVDSAANLLDGALSGAISGSGLAAHIQVQLAGPETLDAQTAESLVSIPGFTDTHNLTIVDDPSYLLNSANLPAEQMAVQVTLAGDETVSANTVLRLSQVPHFTPGTSELVLANNDFANAATLKAIADMGSAFNHNGHSLTMTADVLNLTPTEYVALQSDGVVQNGHALGVTPTGVAVTDSSDMLGVTGSVVAGSTVKLYAADGTVISSNMQTGNAFTVSAADSGIGHNFSLTSVVNGANNEGAPLVVLDASVLESTVAASGGSFDSSGAIQVDTGKFVNLYVAGAVPNLTHAALVYDPVAHTVALDVPGHSPVTLVTLGGSTHPATLDVSEILFKTHG